MFIRIYRIFMNGYFVYSFVSFLFQFINNFIGYTEVAVRPEVVENILLFSFIGNIIYASGILYTFVHWLNPKIQEIRGIQIKPRVKNEMKKVRKIWLLISISLNFILLGFGIIIDYTYFFARSSGLFMLGVFAAMLSLIFGLIFLNRTFHIMSSIQQLFTDIKKKKTFGISLYYK